MDKAGEDLPVAALRAAIAAATPSGATPPRLMGVAKGQEAARVAEAVALGVTDIGENRVAEALAKWPHGTPEGMVRHLIGGLQRNKVREAVAWFDVIHTLDRPALAIVLAEEMARQGRTPRLLIQVNTGEEPQKGGVMPQQLPEFLAYCAPLQLPIIGLMAIPPAQAHPAPHFALLKKLAHRHSLRECCMGMSGDFEIATRLGATMVRVGTALFGARL